MATNLLKLRMGVADDPTALQPSLNDCLEAMLQQAEVLMMDVLRGLELASLPAGAQRIAAFSKGANKAAIDSLRSGSKTVCKTYREELTRLVYHAGGKEQQQTELLRFEDLQLFGDAELDQSIEVARAQQEVSHAVDDVLPVLDSLVSTLLGWRTIQPGLNPLRPEVFVRALQATLAAHVPDGPVREALIAPAAGLLGVNLRKLYRELSEWLTSTGVEPAVPLGGRITKGGGASGAPVNDTMAKTLLTLDRLRKLLAGDFDQPGGRPDFLHTVPASIGLLQEMKGVDALVKRLETKRPRREEPEPETLEEREQIAADAPPQPRIGQQLGEEVVRLMFDNLGSDQRLLAPLKQELKVIEPAVQRLAQDDSRFFSDRTHPARQLLDRITQRSLAFASEDDPGWPRFMKTVEEASQWLGSKVIDADTFGELLDQLQDQWSEQDQALRARREEAARALLHAEQRNLLAQKLGAEFAEQLEGLEVAEFVADFLKGSWAQVVAEAQLSCADGSDDPYGYRALVDDLIWSVQKSTSQRGRTRRLVQMIPGLLAKLRDGLARIEYPPELTQRFFDSLITIHRAAVQEGRDPEAQAAAEAVESEPSRIDTDAAVEAMWMAQAEVSESGYMDVDSYLPPEAAEEIEREAEQEAALEQQIEDARAKSEEDSAPAPLEPVGAAEMKTGTWVELIVEKKWTRMQLTWASPHGTLFMFTSIAGTAHSMSRRTLERLRADGLIRVVADRNVVDEALDNVAKAALRNSLQGKG
ncbi:MAG TPA: DUF1631 family protein [Ramlibacter sp.]|uniref:DUF1631 family protein n=1 Tax=Ramlibacter sp. TaxID=1917967 RepID=UPI002BC9266D|nr:DUF1631 family protein [Ramlibacter sp.]HVZ46669.1 DUF1631 family protein [Ramlibacter sp.]